MTSRFEGGAGADVDHRTPSAAAHDHAANRPESGLEVDQSARRLRDLSARHRLYALALALALLVAPVSSAVRMFDTFTPVSDNALIELRARDVGTSRTPLIGQPSTSGRYGERRIDAAHPGPIEFYMLAPAVRIFGGGTGMLLTGALISSISVLVAAWAVFRQLGPSGGLAAAAALAAVMWTAGAAAMVNPLSSVVGGFPLLCSAVLVWCLVCGDFRLLALTCAVVSFTAQQHLSVVPSAMVIVAAGGIALALALVRGHLGRNTVVRRDLNRNVLVAALVGLVLWAPVLFQQLFRPPGNLRILFRYASDSSRKDVGYPAALRQIGHTLGLPPLLGRTGLSGHDFLVRLSPLTLITALVASGLLLFAGIRWRRREPRLCALVVMTGVVAVGGLLNGAAVPNSLERDRISFYHWARVLAFFELLTLLVAVGRLVRRSRLAQGSLQRLAVPAVVVPVTLMVLLVPAVGNLFISRRDNQIKLLVPKSAIDKVEAGVLEHRDEIRQPTLLLSRNDNIYLGVYEAVAARLDAHGIHVKHQGSRKRSVDRHRIVDYRTVQSALVIALEVGRPVERIPGKLIATANAAPDFDRQAFAQLTRQARSSRRVVPGAALRRLLQSSSNDRGLTPDQRKLFAAIRRATLAMLSQLIEQPEKILARESILQLLADKPLAEPALNHRALERVLRTFPDVQGHSIKATHVSAYLLDRKQLLQYVRLESG